MRVFCTLSDKTYACQGIALLQSLRRHASDFILYYLCLDGETKTMVGKFGGADMVAVGIDEFEADDPQVTACRNRPTLDRHGMVFDPYAQFCYAMTPFWTNRVLGLAGSEGVSYLDSDLFFRQPLAPIFDAMGGRSIGIFRHRHIVGDEPAGEFNVGMVVFRGDETGRECAAWWRGVMLDPANQWAGKYGKCGDQKYLELFIPLFGLDHVAVLDDAIGHGAPWNYHLYKYDGDHIVWNGRRQLLVFNHFSHFTPDFAAGTYREAKGREWGKCVVDPQVRKWYDEYFSEIVKVRGILAT